MSSYSLQCQVLMVSSLWLTIFSSGSSEMSWSSPPSPGHWWPWCLCVPPSDLPTLLTSLLPSTGLQYRTHFCFPVFLSHIHGFVMPAKDRTGHDSRYYHPSFEQEKRFYPEFCLLLFIILPSWSYPVLHAPHFIISYFMSRISFLTSTEFAVTYLHLTSPSRQLQTEPAFHNNN